MVGTTEFRQPERRSGAETKAAILAVATQQFRDHGYTAATLADVADRLGITRSAVLHHFGTKAEVLREIVRPWFTALEELLDAHPARPQTRSGTRLLVADLFDLLVAHRDVVLLMMQDIAVTTTVTGPALDRFTPRVFEAFGGFGDDLALVRAGAVLGALTNVALRLPQAVDRDERGHRRTVIDIVMKLVPR